MSYYVDDATYTLVDDFDSEVESSEVADASEVPLTDPEDGFDFVLPSGSGGWTLVYKPSDIDEYLDEAGTLEGQTNSGS